jgi:DNA polymerase-3 subunit delta
VSALNPLGLSDGDKGGAFFLHGTDAFRKDEAAKSLVDWHLDPASRDFNFDPLRGSEIDLPSLASILATPPMMAEWRVVLLREVEGLAPSPRARDILLETVKAPPPGLALIMTATAPKASRAKFYSDLIRHARSVEFPEISPNDVPGWLVEWARSRHGLELTEGGARALGGALGTDLGVLTREVQKLATMVDEGRPVTQEEVREWVARVPSQDLWEWLDLVGGREFRRALEGLPDLFAQGESAVRLTMSLTTHLLRLGAGRSGGQRVLAESLPASQKSWLSRRLMQQAKLWSIPELLEALRGLQRVDRVLKSTSLSGEQVLEEWLLVAIHDRREGES